MAPCPTLVLDLDGTLADTAPDLVATLNAILRREGLDPVAPEAVRSMIGRGARALLQRGLAAAGETPSVQRLDALFGQFVEHYGAHLADATRLFPGAGAALARFSGAGWRLAICTNKPERLSKALLQALGVAPFFAAICGGDTFDCAKPDPRPVTRTIALAGGSRELAVMVGDSLTDIAAAKAAGVPVVAVDFGYTDVPVGELSPDRVIAHFDELFDAASGLLAPPAMPVRPSPAPVAGAAVSI